MSEEPSQVELAKIGLIALIDEATGYQNERFKDPLALRKMVKGYKHKKIKTPKIFFIFSKIFLDRH